MNINIYKHNDGEVIDKLNLIVAYLKTILQKENSIMADIANLKEDLATIKSGVDSALLKIAELQALIANIPPAAATQADLDELDAKTEEIKAILSPPVPV